MSLTFTYDLEDLTDLLIDVDAFVAVLTARAASHPAFTEALRFARELGVEATRVDGEGGLDGARRAAFHKELMTYMRAVFIDVRKDCAAAIAREKRNPEDASLRAASHALRDALADLNRQIQAAIRRRTWSKATRGTGGKSLAVWLDERKAALALERARRGVRFE